LVLRLVDASVAIDYLRGYEPAGTAIGSVLAAGEDLISSEVVRFELLAGVRPADEPTLERLIAALDWIAVTEDVARRGAEFARRYRAAFGGIDDSDYLIAATADLLHAPLLTRNVRHFPMFPDLHPPY
jgi:predicted nucleic acid-binding protein